MEKKINVTVDTSKLVNMLEDCQAELKEITDKIEAFNDKFYFAEIKASVGYADTKKVYESCFPMMTILYGVKGE